MQSLLKECIEKFWIVNSLWTRLRSRQLHNSYEARREHYRRLSAEPGYGERQIIHQIQGRLKKRGYSVRPGRIGDIHTFAFIPNLSWHRHLLPDLRTLGPVTQFDYVLQGFQVRRLYAGDVNHRKELNNLWFDVLLEAHQKHPVDWVFIYAGGAEVSASVVKRVTDEIGVPVVNMCLDDKQSWAGKWAGDQRIGQIDLAGAFDLSWTSARVTCDWYVAEGGRAIYMPEGCDISTYGPISCTCDIPVSFVGAAYGFRKQTIRYLEEYGVPVSVFGPGWGTTSVWGEDAARVMNRSVINLGMGGIGYSESLTNVKTRDFEVPAAGGGVYLTSFNADLAQHFVIGREILCYRDRIEMLELIRYYLSHPQEAKEIAARARQRCISEHRWLHRYQKVCELLGILQPGVATDEPVACNFRMAEAV